MPIFMKTPYLHGIGDLDNLPKNGMDYTMIRLFLANLIMERGMGKRLGFMEKWVKRYLQETAICEKMKIVYHDDSLPEEI